MLVAFHNGANLGISLTGGALGPSGFYSGT